MRSPASPLKRRVGQCHQLQQRNRDRILATGGRLGMGNNRRQNRYGQSRLYSALGWQSGHCGPRKIITLKRIAAHDKHNLDIKETKTRSFARSVAIPMHREYDQAPMVITRLSGWIDFGEGKAAAPAWIIPTRRLFYAIGPLQGAVTLIPAAAAIITMVASLRVRKSSVNEL